MHTERSNQRENLTGTDAAAIGDVLLQDERVRKITFTGSTEVGKILMRKAADTVKRVSLELGGHAPFLVFEDADLKAAAREVIASKFRNAGQTLSVPTASMCIIV